MNLALSPKDSKLYDVIIIGGGPAGASAAVYTARAEFDTLVVDKGLTAGALGMAGEIANYPGLNDPIGGPELVRRIREQATSFGAEFVTEKVLSVDLESEPKQVWTDEGLHKGRAVIIATGAMGRKRHITGEKRFLGRGVSYCATCDGAFFRDQEVAVAGNNDEAVEEALTLTRFASQVHFLSPTEALQTSPALEDELVSHPKVAFYPKTHLREVRGNGKVEAVSILSQGDESSIMVNGAFIYLQGNKPVTDFLNGQLSTAEEGCLAVDSNFQTVIPGVFAAGDVLCRHIKQAAVASGEGVQAAMAVDRYLHGREKLRPDWSS